LHYSLSRFIVSGQIIPDGFQEINRNGGTAYCMTGVASCARGVCTNDWVSQRAFASGRSHSIFPKSLAIYLQRIIVSYCSRVGMRTVARGQYMARTKTTNGSTTGANLGFEAQLWPIRVAAPFL